MHTQRPAGAGWRGDVDDGAPPLTSMCFSLSAHVHSMSLAPGASTSSSATTAAAAENNNNNNNNSPGGSWCLVCGMKDGAVRLFNLLPSGNSWPDDRWGHELGRFSTSSGGGMGLSDQLDLHVEVSSDGQHVFAGPRRRSTRLVVWNLPQARSLVEVGWPFAPHSPFAFFDSRAAFRRNFLVPFVFSFFPFCFLFRVLPSARCMSTSPLSFELTFPINAFQSVLSLN